MPKALIALMTLVVALSSGDQRMSPEETVRRYCALEFDGQTLTPEGRSKRAALLAAAPLAPDPSGDRLVIVRDYVVKRDRVEAHAASIVADYAMFGTLDASLRFTRVEGRRPQAPTRQRRDFTLVSGGVRDRRSPDDRARAASGRMPWKIESHRDPFGHLRRPGCRHPLCDRCPRGVARSGDQGERRSDVEDADTTRGRRTFPAGVDRVEDAAGRRGGVLHARCGWWTHDTGRHA